MNPLSEVVEKLDKFEFVIKGGMQVREGKFLQFHTQRVGYQLELRCINQHNLAETTFPHHCYVQLNGRDGRTFTPLLIKSSLHKRKDNPLLMDIHQQCNNL